jgi:trypsin-like peptidase
MRTEAQLEADARQRALGGVVRVGDGRGFIVEAKTHFGFHPYVITAAHCLPPQRDGQMLPPPHGESYTRIYPKLLAPLGGQPSVSCECLFVDPIADIAVLGRPDDQLCPEQSIAYRKSFIYSTTPLVVAAPRTQCPALLLSLSNKWFACRVQHQVGGMLWIENAAEDIVGGMSGSPIIAGDGTAIGIVCTSSGSTASREGGPNPGLMGNLPGWFLQALADAAEFGDDQ